MAKRLTIEELMKEAISVWHMEGMDPTDSDTPLYNLHNDPVTRLLMGAVNYQSNNITDDIVSFRNDLADECLDLAAPEYLFSPIPSIGMLQTCKKHSIGIKNAERTIIDSNISFVFTKDVGIKRMSIPFMPLLSISIMDLNIRSVEKVGRCRWRMEIEDMEETESLNGLSFYLPNLELSNDSNQYYDRSNETNDCIKLYAGDVPLPVCNISDFDRLPFVTQFMQSMVYSKNAMQCNVLQNIQDTFCCHANNYCVVDNIKEKVSLPKRDGCFLIDIELPSVYDYTQLSTDDILLNCVPIVNVELHTTNLTQFKPVQKIEIDNGFFLTILATDDSCNSNSFALRKVATSRLSPELWSKKMGQLIEQYNAQYNVMEHLLDDKVKQTMLPALQSLKQSLSKQKTQDDGLYLVLKNKMIQSLSAPWLSTSGKMANDFDQESKVQCSSAELDSERTKLISKTVGGRDPVTDTEKRQRAMRYYQVSRDRIISKADIVAFCRYKLSQKFAVSNDDIEEIRIYDTVRNSHEGFYERILMVDIKLKNCGIDTRQASLSLDRMIRFRTASSTPIRVIINSQ